MQASELKGKSIGFIGAGNMAEAILRGLINAGLDNDRKIFFTDPVPARRELFTKLGCEACETPSDVAKFADILLLAVKPQVIDAIVGGMAKDVRPGTHVISIAAGVSCSRLEAMLNENVRVVRVMPNTPMLAGQGVAGVAKGTRANTADVAATVAIFAAGGVAREIPESLMDAVTAVSGSGPAYFFRFVEALAEAAKNAGLPADVAEEFAKGTFIGSAKLLAESGDTPAKLREKVTSPGGTTYAALQSFERSDIGRIVNDAVAAAAARSKELGAGKK